MQCTRRGTHCEEALDKALKQGPAQSLARVPLTWLLLLGWRNLFHPESAPLPSPPPV